MHIVHLMTRLLRAGSEENTIATCAYQAAAGHRVTVLHGSGHDPFWDQNLPHGVVRIEVPQLCHPVRPLQDVRAWIIMRKMLRELLPDVVHTHQSKAGILGCLAARAVPQAAVVHGVHIVPFEVVGRLKRLFYLAAERIVAPRTDAFIGVSEAVCDAYVNAGLADPRSAQRRAIHCVRSGMDLDRFRVAGPPQDHAQLLKRTLDAPDAKVVLMLAAFEPRKRQIPFLYALAAQKNRLPAIHVLFAGTGPDLPKARAAAKALNLEDHVTFCGYRSDPEALLMLSDFTILTSEREGLPRVAVQSIAASRPMLTQPLPGIEEIIAHDRNGWIMEGADMDDFVTQLGALLRDDARLQRLARGAQTTDLSAWDLDRLGADTTAIYEDIMRPSEVTHASETHHDAVH